MRCSSTTFIGGRAMVAVVAAGALASAGCGGSDKASGPRASLEPDAAARAASSTPAATRLRGNRIDRAFVAAMVPHHRSAIAAAKIARRQASTAFVKRLARQTVSSRARQISVMRRQDRALKRAGVRRGSPGLLPPMKGVDAHRLRAASPFDPAFLKLMIADHAAAIDVARVEIAGGRDRELIGLATRIVNAYKRELRQMRKHLAKAAVRPPASPAEQRDPRAGSPDMPGIDDSTGVPSATE